MEQSKIWAHFQDPAHAGFAGAESRYRVLVALAERSIGRGSALNVGIGGGGVERRLEAAGWDVASVDPDPAAVARLGQEGIDARQGYLQQLPFESDRFDVIIVSEVLEHIADDVRRDAVAEMRRVLREGGILIGTVPFRERLDDQRTVCPACGHTFHRWGHVASFDAASIRALLAPHFEVRRCAPRSFVDWHGSKSPRRWLKNVAKLALGRLGEPLAAPSLVFVGRALKNRA
jgi:SAM-dependent methyltransferase